MASGRARDHRFLGPDDELESILPIGVHGAFGHPFPVKRDLRLADMSTRDDGAFKDEARDWP